MTIKHLAWLPAIVIAVNGSILFGQYSSNFGDQLPLQEYQPQTNSDDLARYRERINAKVGQLQTKMLSTVDGNIIFQFPNYDIAINGTPSYPGQGNGTPRSSDGGGQPQSEMSSTRVIWKSDQGYSWDGSNFLLSPNYSYELYIGDRYRRQVIGKPNEFWTPNKCEPSHEGEFELPSQEKQLSFLPTVTKSARTLEEMQSTLPKARWGSHPKAIENDNQGDDKETDKLNLDEMESPRSKVETSRRRAQPYAARPSSRLRADRVQQGHLPTARRVSAKNNRSLNTSNIDFLRNGFKQSNRPASPPTNQTSRPGYRLPVR